MVRVRRRRFKDSVIFNAICLRDTLFYVVISVFPVTLFLFKERYITWYVISGYLYGLVVSTIVGLIKNPRRESFLGVSIKMIKIVLLLSSFVMILLNKSTYRVRLDPISIAFFVVLFICVYYEVYQDNRRKA
ncbi:MAG: hypothetical protein LBQ46_02620 [Treponema sp.]|jgi:hypothetical protein|nr:hypothetical protein [Treponema sp.]